MTYEKKKLSKLIVEAKKLVNSLSFFIHEAMEWYNKLISILDVIRDFIEATDLNIFEALNDRISDIEFEIDNIKEEIKSIQRFIKNDLWNIIDETIDDYDCYCEDTTNDYRIDKLEEKIEDLEMKIEELEDELENS